MTTIRPPLPDGLAESTLERIEKIVLASAEPLLTARRFLGFEGPLGGGFTSVQVGALVQHDAGAVQITGRRALAVPTLDAEFVLPLSEVEATQRFGHPLPMLQAELAGERVALAEERVVYRGVAELGIAGLLSHARINSLPLESWDDPGRAVENFIAAADKLDAAGARGPFALVLAPSLYNALFRKYEDSDVLALDHLRRLAARGIFKSHALAAAPKDGRGASWGGGDMAVMVSPEVGPLVCGRDLHVRYLETTASGIRFVASAAIVLRLDVPEAACVIARAVPAAA